MILDKRGQVWVETVVYTLIGLALIGLVLAILTPRINEFRDRSVIEQTIDSLNIVDSKVNEVLEAPGNKRRIEFTLARGSLYIDTLNDSLRYVFENSRSPYSEPGLTISVGRVDITTTELSKNYRVEIEMFYNHNVTFSGSDGNEAVLSAASIPYELFVENRDRDGNGNINIDFSSG